MHLLELYTSLLKVANMAVTEDGFINGKFLDSVSPVMVKGKRLVMPTPAHLAKPSPDTQIIFHPLSENMMRDTSVVLDHYRLAVNNRLNYTLGLLMYELLIIASSSGLHAGLTPDQAEFLNKVKHADDKTLEVFGKLLTKMPAGQQKDVIVNIYLKRGGLVGGKKYQRVGITTFPFYNELKKGEGEVYGVKLRVKDRETLINLLEYIFPQIDIPEAYNVGTNAKLAPNVDSLMKTVLGIGAPINDQVNLFGNLMDKSDSLMIESDWVETFENLETMRPQVNMIPMQAGNEGMSLNEAAAPVSNVPVPAQVQYQNTIQPTPPPYQNTQAPMNAVPGIVVTPGGLDFASLTRVVPSLAPQQNFYQGNQMVNNDPGRLPGWAIPQQPLYRQPQPQPVYQQPQVSPIYQTHQQPQQQYQPPQQQYQQPQQNGYYSNSPQPNLNAY